MSSRRQKPGLTPTQKYEIYRAEYLPGQLERARLKVKHLEIEAKRLGLTHLLEKKDDIPN